MAQSQEDPALGSGAAAPASLPAKLARIIVHVQRVALRPFVRTWTRCSQPFATSIPSPGLEDELVVVLLQCRRRLEGHDPEDGHLMAEDLALELDHDRMLLRLCRALGIESDPSRFVNPLAERDRLERILRQSGVDFRTLDDNRRVPSAEPAAGTGSAPARPFPSVVQRFGVGAGPGPPALRSASTAA